jgi:hypothetical protein
MNFFVIFQEKSPIKNFLKNLVGAALFHVGGQADGQI